MNNVGYIYKITNNINGKSYIGQTKHFYEYRWNEHKCRYLNKNSKAYNISLYRAFRKYGVSDNTVRKWCKKYNLPYRKYK